MAFVKSRTRKNVSSTETVELPVMLPYKEYSKGGRALSRALDMVYLRVSRGFQVAPNQPLVVINWGSAASFNFRSLEKGWPIKRVINHWSKVSTAGDKLASFRLMKGSGVSVPEFTDKFEDAMEWVEAGHEVMGRKRRGSQGKDIAFFNEDLEDFTNAEFWVQYKKKKDEFRVHVFNGRVLDVQRKAVRKTDPDGNPVDTSNVDFRIRNLANGFVFVRNDIHVPQIVYDEALKAVSALELDFGAVDVIYNGTEGKAYVLEVNTAPGLEGTTLDNYTSAFKELLSGILTKKTDVPSPATEPSS